MNHRPCDPCDRFFARHPQAPAPPPGCDLAPHHAQTVHASEAQRLHILQGRVWLTLSGAGRPGDHSGDHFLAAGDSLLLPAGTRVVFEAYPAHQPVRWACSAAEPANAVTSVFQRLRLLLGGRSRLTQVSCTGRAPAETDSLPTMGQTLRQSLPAIG